MVTFKEATQALYQGLVPHGFVGRGRMWRLPGEDVHWAAEIEQSPYGPRTAVDFGCVIIPGTPPPKRLPDCQISARAQFVPLDYGHDILLVCNLGRELDEDFRLQALQELGDSIGKYVLERQTLDALRAAYRDGEFSNVFLHHKARTLLEQDG